LPTAYAFAAKEPLTSHSLGHSFMQERCTDLFVMRDNLVARQLPALFKRSVPKKNPINEFLADPTLKWKRNMPH